MDAYIPRILNRKLNKRGAVFENLAMAELLKSRYNRGLDPNLYFYREKSGREVDALMLEGGFSSRWNKAWRRSGNVSQKNTNFALSKVRI